MPRPSQHLRAETSPYLQRAASDPISWYPYGEAAFAAAQAQNRPILLSIGYSACHFCQRMEQESFRDPEIAALLEAHFVCIKVDREERPDVDATYLSALTLLTGTGGWPANLFLLPTGQPFFGGTYFPAREAAGRPGFLQLLQKITELWSGDRAELEHQAAELTLAVQRQTQPKKPHGISIDARRLARHKLDQVFDPFFGGFGRAPKFPTPGALRFLLGELARSGAEPLADPSGHRSAADMALFTLDRMTQGGIYDQIGGGFFRYATDERWLLPHFEKLTADQAQLAEIYLEAFRLTGKPNYRRVARETLDFLLSDLRGAHGGFFSSLDAGGPGGEGAYYLLSPREVRSAAGEPAATHFCAFFGIGPEGPYGGKSLPSLQRPLSEVAREFGLGEGELGESLQNAQHAVREARRGLPPPEVDDKVISCVNGLVIKTLVRAAVLLDEASYLEAAERAAHFVLTQLRAEDGRLRRHFRGEKSHVEGFLDDYVDLADGLLALYELTGHGPWLEHSLELSHKALELFSAKDTSALTLSAAGTETLSPLHPADDATLPPANAVAIRLLMRLSVHTGQESLRTRAEEIAAALSADLARAPERHTDLLEATTPLFSAPISIVVAGSEEQSAELLQATWKAAPPWVVLARAAPRVPRARSSVLVTETSPLDGGAQALLCSERTCLPPCLTSDDLRAELSVLLAKTWAERRRELARTPLPGRATAEATRRYLDRRDVRETARSTVGDLFVSALGLGTRRVGLDADAHRQALRKAMFGGMNLIDTSPAFALGDSERLVGEVLFDLCAEGAERDAFVLCTKVGVAVGAYAEEVSKHTAWSAEAIPLTPGGQLKDGAFCLQEDFLSTQIERSLERLGVLHLDIVLLQSPEHLLLAGQTWEEARVLLRRALLHLEKECSRGRVGQIGIFSATAGRAADDRGRLPVLELLAMAEEVAGPEHHFRVVEMPINLVEHEVLLPLAAPLAAAAGSRQGADQSLSLAAQLMNRGVAVLAARPLSALTDGAVTRLVDPPATGAGVDAPSRGSPHEPDPAGLRAARYKVASLEAEFETTFAARLRLAGFSHQGPFLPLSGSLGKTLEQVHSLEQFHLAETTMITPRLRGLLRQLDHTFRDDPGREWLRFRQAYTRAVGDYLAAIALIAMEKNLALLRRLRREIRHGTPFAGLPSAQTPPARSGQFALAVLMEHPNISAACLGLRSPTHAEEALLLLK